MAATLCTRPDARVIFVPAKVENRMMLSPGCPVQDVRCKHEGFSRSAVRFRIDNRFRFVASEERTLQQQQRTLFFYFKTFGVVALIAR